MQSHISVFVFDERLLWEIHSHKTNQRQFIYTTEQKFLVVTKDQNFPHSWLITGFVTRLIRRVPLVEQKLLTLPEHMSSPPVFSGVFGTRSLVLCVCFVDRCLSFCTFSFGHCVVCSSSIYGFRLPLWYPQTLLVVTKHSPLI
jgi:hypothetical protein